MNSKYCTNLRVISIQFHSIQRTQNVLFVEVTRLSTVTNSTITVVLHQVNHTYDRGRARVSVCECMGAYVCVCMYVCMGVYVCVYVCVYVNMSMG
jgi:hypothetical protein